jgi:hypothetical protein
VLKVKLVLKVIMGQTVELVLLVLLEIKVFKAFKVLKDSLEMKDHRVLLVADHRVLKVKKEM